MKKLNLIKTLILIISLFYLTLALPTLPTACAFQEPTKEKLVQKQLVGTWVLVEAPEIRPDGSKAQTFGPNPKGILIIDETGQYSLQIYQSDRPKFASGDKRRGSDKEYQTAMLGMSSHFGHCFLEPEKGVIIFQIECASFPNWEGTEQKRQYQLSNNVLTYQVPVTANGNEITTISTWRRVQ